MDVHERQQACTSPEREPRTVSSTTGAGCKISIAAALTPREWARKRRPHLLSPRSDRLTDRSSRNWP